MKSTCGHCGTVNRVSTLGRSRPCDDCGRPVRIGTGWVVAATVGVLLLIGLAAPALQTVYWVGSSETGVRVRVTDSVTGMPIEQAAVRLVDTREIYPDVEARAGKDGLAELTARFKSFGHDSLLESRSYLGLYDREIHASASGYSDGRLSLWETVGDQSDRAEPLPILRVELHHTPGLDPEPGDRGRGEENE